MIGCAVGFSGLIIIPYLTRVDSDLLGVRYKSKMHGSHGSDDEMVNLNKQSAYHFYESQVALPVESFNFYEISSFMHWNLFFFIESEINRQ